MDRWMSGRMKVRGPPSHTIYNSNNDLRLDFSTEKKAVKGYGRAAGGTAPSPRGRTVSGSWPPGEGILAAAISLLLSEAKDELLSARCPTSAFLGAGRSNRQDHAELDAEGRTQTATPRATCLPTCRPSHPRLRAPDAPARKPKPWGHLRESSTTSSNGTCKVCWVGGAGLGTRPRGGLVSLHQSYVDTAGD